MDTASKAAWVPIHTIHGMELMPALPQLVRKSNLNRPVRWIFGASIQGPSGVPFFPRLVGGRAEIVGRMQCLKTLVGRRLVFQQTLGRSVS